MFTACGTGLRRALIASLALVSAVAIAGCGTKSDGTLSGKVTLDGKPVSGQLVFVGSDQKEYLTGIGPDGEYQIKGVPKGNAQILVKTPVRQDTVTKGGISTARCPAWQRRRGSCRRPSTRPPPGD